MFSPGPREESCTLGAGAKSCVLEVGVRCVEDALGIGQRSVEESSCSTSFKPYVPVEGRRKFIEPSFLNRMELIRSCLHFSSSTMVCVAVDRKVGARSSIGRFPFSRDGCLTCFFGTLVSCFWSSIRLALLFGRRFVKGADVRGCMERPHAEFWRCSEYFNSLRIDGTRLTGFFWNLLHSL